MKRPIITHMNKTNAVRMLETRGISFQLLSYEVDESDLGAVSVAAKAGIDIDRVFKTLVLRDSSAEVFVCVIPGACELDLKKAAQAAGVKKADLIPVKDILKLTGYVRGGCSPVGMKKTYPTFIDETCQLYEQIFVSAGARGLQLLISPGDLIDVVSAEITELV